MKNVSVLDRINQQFTILTQQEKKLALYIQENLSKIPQLNIQELSKITNTSNSAVSRLMQKLDYASFSIMKNMIAQELSARSGKNFNSVSGRIVTYYEELLGASQELIDAAKVLELVVEIKRARKILIFALGSSYHSALEFKTRLERMGLMVDVNSDNHNMMMMTSLLSEEDLIIGISSLGETQALLDACEIAQKNHVPIWAITSRNHTSLTKIATEAIFTSNIDTMRDPYFINSQIAIMLVIDTISYVLLEDKHYFANRQKTLTALKNMRN